MPNFVDSSTIYIQHCSFFSIFPDTDTPFAKSFLSELRIIKCLFGGQKICGNPVSSAIWGICLTSSLELLYNSVSCRKWLVMEVILIHKMQSGWNAIDYFPLGRLGFTSVVNLFQLSFVAFNMWFKNFSLNQL